MRRWMRGAHLTVLSSCAAHICERRGKLIEFESCTVDCGSWTRWIAAMLDAYVLSIDNLFIFVGFYLFSLFHSLARTILQFDLMQTVDVCYVRARFLSNITRRKQTHTHSVCVCATWFHIQHYPISLNKTPVVLLCAHNSHCGLWSIVLAARVLRMSVYAFLSKTWAFHCFDAHLCLERWIESKQAVARCSSRHSLVARYSRQRWHDAHVVSTKVWFSLCFYFTSRVLFSFVVLLLRFLLVSY